MYELFSFIINITKFDISAAKNLISIFGKRRTINNVEAMMRVC